jgi:3D (Asp-Asp-Asp) domain-containing protein
MKLSCLRPITALLLTLGLAACGGKASYDVSGTISNLNTNGLILANGGENLPVEAGKTSFTFAKRIDYGTDYNITVQQQPAHMNCAVSGGSGSAGRYLSIEAAVTCMQNTYTLGGTVTGLTADGLVLINGTAQTTVAKDSTTFTLATRVADGDKYGISVFTQPTGLKCDVAANTGVGVMGEANVTTVQITCNPR